VEALGAEALKTRLRNSYNFLKVGQRVTESDHYQFGSFRVDAARRLLTRDGVPVPVAFQVFEMLLALIRNPGRVLTKDELMAAIWPDRIVDEGSLTQAIFMLRKALSRAGDEGRYIATVPGRGYCFTAQIQQLATDAPAASPNALSSLQAEHTELERQPKPPHARTNSALSSRPIGRYLAGVGAFAVLVTGIAVFAWDRGQLDTSTKTSALVLAGFENFTNDPALGTVLGNVLEIDLAQSPFLILMSPQQVNQTLRLMERPNGTRLTPELAQDVCVRNQSNAVLSGTVAKVGKRYVVTLEARDCGSGSVIVADKAEAGREEDLPKVLDKLAVNIREGLSDSSVSIHKFNVPIAEATTASLEALKAFSRGEQARAGGDNAAAIPFFRQALDLDPSFALAYEELGSAYVGQAEPELAKTYYRKAFEFRSRASAIEKLQIASHYDQFIGNIPEAIHTYIVWAQTYPQDWVPRSNLANLYTDIAKYPEAMEAGREALRLNPRNASPYVVLARAYKRSNRFAEAKAVCQKAVSRRLDGWSIHGLQYEIAFVQNDPATMAEQVAEEENKPTESFMLDYEAWAAATAGKVRQANALFAQAAATARSQGPDHSEEASEILVDNIAMLADFGLNDRAQQIALKAAGLDEDDDAPFALAKAGAVKRAAVLATALNSRYPDSTMIVDIERPLIQAAIDIKQDRPSDAIRILNPALPFELRDFDIPSLLGQAYLGAHSGEKAAAQYEMILANRGVDGLSPLYPLAYLGLARALRLRGKLVESRTAYQKLLAFWKDADVDLPILQEAKREYAKLSSSLAAKGKRS
jgi:eukaryotic-like serine/threonine-protein kinase